ncbi:hypothetical protein, partial [Hoeflea sp.]|uniref:hypothetical protein n=1 Tax=Hoeflea sp. TaxID=1940281 RepID=UPI0025C41D7A
KDVPAYPIHDCLLVKFSDREKVIRELHLSQIAQLGKMLPMDLSYHRGGRRNSDQLLRWIA